MWFVVAVVLGTAVIVDGPLPSWKACNSRINYHKDYLQNQAADLLEGRIELKSNQPSIETAKIYLVCLGT